jgi:hypothetical protein
VGKVLLSEALYPFGSTPEKGELKAVSRRRNERLLSFGVQLTSVVPPLRLIVRMRAVVARKGEPCAFSRDRKLGRRGEY